MADAEVDFNRIAQKWQKKWAEAGIFKVKENLKKPKFFCLEMYPYPSGSGLHMGHVRNYAIGDCYARYKRMGGFNVLYPMGYDSFGLPAENAAIKSKVDPKKWTESNIALMKSQQKLLGLSYDWSRELASHYPEYYKWNQWIFLKMLEKGLAYKKLAAANWCPSCQTVLANEQVREGKCWRCSSLVEQKELEQWFLKITAYADQLLNDLDKLGNWPERVKVMQRNWIGKSEGVEIFFPVEHNFVLLHGFGGTTDGAFFPGLKQQLDALGLKYTASQLPNAEDPEEEEQVNFILKNVNFDENTVIVALSLGCAVALKVVERLEKKISGLVLVGGFIEPKFKDKSRPFAKKFSWKFDFDKIKRHVGFIKVLSDTTDYAVPLEQGRILAQKLKAELIEIKADEPHFQSRVEPSVLEHAIPKISTFTTRPDTIFSVTFVVLAPEHSLVSELTKGTKHEKEVAEFVKSAIRESTIDRLNEEKEKKGVFTGRYAINPASKEKIPILVANFAVMEYGTGAVMCDAHDKRDFKFAKKYDIPLKVVIRPANKPDFSVEQLSEAYTEAGIMINSDQFNGQTNAEALPKIAGWLVKNKNAKKVTNYKLRDWLISRQRYWGTPIPVVYCKKCGIAPVPEKDLPVVLPEPEKIKFTGEGNPLDSCSEFVNVKCPKCKANARRETDTMDTFVDSSWYFLRYCSNKEQKMPFDKKAAEYWMPVDQYIGGIEHAVMHLLYARFFTKVLRDLKLVDVDEPFSNLLCQGMVLKDGAVMSKSRGNVVDPREIISKYGPDTARLFILFMAMPEKELEWADKGVEGSFRLLRKIYSLATKKLSYGSGKELTSKDKQVLSKTHSTIKKTTELVEEFRLNAAIGAVIEMVNALSKYGEGEVNKEVYKEALLNLTLLAAPFAPHIAEELWEIQGHKGFVSLQSWPEYEEEKIDKEAEAAEQLVHDTLSDFETVLQLAKIEKPKEVMLLVAPSWKYELFRILKDEIKKTRDQRALINTCLAEKDIKPHGQEVAKMVQAVLKDPGKLPQMIIAKEKEQEAYAAAKEAIEKGYGAKVKVEDAEKSTEQKARQAMPGKPAIIVK